MNLWTSIYRNTQKYESDENCIQDYDYRNGYTQDATVVTHEFSARNTSHL